MFRGIIKCGDADKNVPVMDPYKFNLEKAQLQAVINAELNITNGVVTGLSDFRLEDFVFKKDEVSLDVVIKIPVIKLDSEYYEMEGKILDIFPIAGTGFLYVIAKDVTIYSRLYLKQSTNGKCVVIDRLENTSFTVDKILSHTEFDKNIDNVLNAMIEDLLAGYLTRFSKFISKTYEGYVVSMLNEVLNKYETWSILATILHK
ncbi:uncharacterized protein LOC114352197 [Ostrinia furnacalis]|uniref:uncharacterized protein LOC114352197 n=1 Tax=Ostrinia furnacalis TaxID=93504 RepID=UPI0010398312|nr:uncharacterized protein LOC114352197 [Ostrinia furnacalis]